jgi:hypothetical protein
LALLALKIFIENFLYQQGRILPYLNDEIHYVYQLTMDFKQKNDVDTAKRHS